ncbi:MAG: 4Fe-4S dicluster protein [Haloplasmataceae bacterium]|jgi:[FeFe] hydrogenase (group B1/B3)|nr:4Fe-4S dicluster protein [Haloplasmataceae bacterium]
MRRYESQVQYIRYQVIKEITKSILNKDFDKNRHKLPKVIIPGNKPLYRCCVYKEREIISERINLAVEPIDESNNIIEIIDIACDECPAIRYKVTEACRGCLAHKCVQACNRDAIQVINGKSIIDYSKCVSCGRCKDVCPYNAISDVMRPCMKACSSKAIVIGEDNIVNINRDKCTNCGACVYQCPFGAVTDRSEIVPVIDAIEEAKVNNKNVYAVIAPSIASQYNIRIGKVVNAIKKLGFKDVIEAALGADIVSYYETEEYVERVIEGNEPCLMTSCCPSFVTYVKKNYPDLSKYISTTVSPMIAVSRLIKKTDKDSTVVFIGPCTSKKAEKNEKDLKGSTDYVLTFEELEAILDANGIDINECNDDVLDNASHFGRLFARSGGVKDAIIQVLKEKGITDFEFKPIACNGIQEVEKALKLLKIKKNQFNFVEGMACIGGCIGGAVSITHKDNKMVDEYAALAKERNIIESLRVLDLQDIKLHRNISE